MHAVGQADAQIGTAGDEEAGRQPAVYPLDQVEMSHVVLRIRLQPALDAVKERGRRHAEQLPELSPDYRQKLVVVEVHGARAA